MSPQARVPVLRRALVAAALALGAPGCEAKPEAPVGPAAPEAKAAEAADADKGMAALVDGYRGPESGAPPGDAVSELAEAGEAADRAEPIPGPFVGGPLPTGPVATVGAVEIPMAAMREIYELKVAKYAERGRAIPPSADRRYRKSISQRLIMHELVAQEVKRLGVDYDPAALAEREEAQRRGIRDWAKHLARRGETEASLRAMVVTELRETAILEKLGELHVSAAEVDTDYEKIKENWRSEHPRVRASHILVAIGSKPAPGAPEPSAADTRRWTAEAKKTAREIYAEVTRPGADFAAVARARSSGPSAAKGGDVGIFTRERMAEEFSDAAFKLSVGGISRPVKTKFGFHIIKLTGKWPPGVLPKDALEGQIRDRMRQRKLHDERRELGERLRRDTVVVDNIAPTLGPEPRRRRPGAEHGDPKTEAKAP